MAMDWDYDVALLQQKNDKIKWVLPDEGVHAYLEGFTAVQDTSKIDVIQAFLNFLAEPAQYADFVNTTGTAYMMPAATPLMEKSISQNPILVPTDEVLAKTEFDKYLGADGATLWTNTWERDQGGVAGEPRHDAASAAHRGGGACDSSRLGRLALLLPTLLITAVCFVVPLGLIALYSFGSVNQVNFDVYFGWTIQNYRDFTSSLYVHTLARSVVLSVSTTLVCAVLGFTFAYFISRQPPRAQRLLLVAVIVPFWTSFIVRTYAWVDLLQNLGPVDRFARAPGPARAHRHPLHASTRSHRHPLLVPAADDPADLRVAGADRSGAASTRPPTWARRRGASSGGWCCRMAVPGLIAGIIIVGVPALGEYVIPEILGGGKTLMAGNILADQFLETGNYPFGSALAVTVMVVLMAAAVPACGAPSRRRRRAVSIRRHPFAAPLSLLILLFMWLPLIVVAVNSFNTETLMAGWGGFTTPLVQAGLHNQNVRTGLKTTLIIAVASSLLSLVSRSRVRSGGGTPRRRRGPSTTG